MGKIVFEGENDNFNDVIAVYMVKYGVGDMAADMTDKNKQNLKKVLDDMCSYTTFTGTVTENGKSVRKTCLYKQRFISQVMISKAVGRTCEDIDQATLSYAEIKAVATVNPLIREKMEVDNEVQRLKLLKVSYDNQRYTLQDNFMIRFPKLIKAAKEKLECVKEDVRHRDDELIANPKFSIKIQGITYTERVDAGTQALSVISKCKTGETTAIGFYKGFELLVEKNFMGFNYIVLKGKSEYKAELSTSPVGSMIKLENLFNGLEENVEFLEKKIEQYENDLNTSKVEYEKPFAHEDEYKEKLARQCELNARLDLENKDMVDADLGIKDEEVTEEKNYISNEIDYNVSNNSYTNKDIKTSEVMKFAEDVAESTPDYKIESSRGR